MLLTEFPYPSGNLHMGHWYSFAVPDIKARYLRMKGFNVMYPIGFDAFGLPAENAAIERNIHPEKWTKQNIAYMTKQLKSMGATFDWSRQVSTIEPEYYKWTQWIFLQLYKKGLAYRAETKVNWCPKDKTVLANEQVVTRSTGLEQVATCDRCGSGVEQRELSQWMFKITDYADRLIDDIKSFDWPEVIKKAQENWIGRSEGTIAEFKIDNFEDSIEVFTTRIDTIFGVTYIVLAPEHPLVEKLKTHILNLAQVEAYIDKAKKKTELQRISDVKDKTGVQFTGITAINPMTGEKIPVWVADYVLVYYGTGAVMAVPAHDERDYEFAKKYKLQIKKVIRPAALKKIYQNAESIAMGAPTELRPIVQECFTIDGELFNSDGFNGLASVEARKKITETLIEKGLGNSQKTYRLHDWILSRQRYWGVPIPMIYCKECARQPGGQGYQEVPEKDLPVKLPSLKDFKPADDGRSPLAKAEKWLKVKCPNCDKWAERETDTMDTFVDSSWYFIRYTDPKNKKQFADKKKMKIWLPVPLYFGGPEHNTMHLLYSRFFTKALYDLGHVHFNEPFTARRNHSIVLGQDGQKMSKSKGNVVDPDKEVARFGADSIRMYLAFMGPYSDQMMPWNPDGIKGVSRFLNRVWKFVNDFDAKTNVNDAKVNKELNKAIKTVGNDVSNNNFNTGVSELMKLLNVIEDKQLNKIQYEIFLRILAPFAPHLAEELWISVLGNKKSIHLESWPEYDSKLFQDAKIQMVAQVNGKVRDTIMVDRGLDENQARFLALASEKVKNFISDKEVKRVIYVKDRLINLVK